jgi:hypothetical protein
MSLHCSPVVKLIHSSAWNKNYANFAFWGFSEVRPYGVLRSSAILQNQGLGRGPSRGRPFAFLRLGVYF